LAFRRLLSTVHRGTAFETRALSLLQNNLSMTLTPVGGRGDGGIDLQGWWWLPSENKAPHTEADERGSEKCGFLASKRRKVRVLVQCKAETKRLSPKYVRELEGVASRYVYELLKPTCTPADGEQASQVEDFAPPLDAVVAILVSTSPFTKASTLHAHSSPVPFFLIHLPPLAPSPAGIPDDVNKEASSSPQTEEEEEFKGSAVLNPALSGTSVKDILGLGGELEVRWERKLKSRSSAKRGIEETPRLGLWFRGKRVRNWIPGSV